MRYMLRRDWALQKGGGFGGHCFECLEKDLRQVLHVVDWHIVVITLSGTSVKMFVTERGHK